MYRIKHTGVNVLFLTVHVSQSVLDWCCLWASSTFIREWFNEELETYFNGAQSVKDRVAQKFFINHVVKDEAKKLLAVNSFLNANSTMLIDIPLLHPCKKSDQVRLPMMVVLTTWEFYHPESHCWGRSDLAQLQIYFFLKFGKQILLRCFKLKKSWSILLTASYSNSPKRSHYMLHWCLMKTWLKFRASYILNNMISLVFSR